ncbi:hypothetical protein BD310DRAFT_32252 [Dichomitus squalens]|uniref:Uncharacterized protein n=1 Tax=Dichomitus squalens TaxID=114155 RepID=A0A4Q9QDY5_9APHY|nr:hypothetical protein BD310DRAFT_32252 [Dichomitus squalens]
MHCLTPRLFRWHASRSRSCCTWSLTSATQMRGSARSREETRLRRLNSQVCQEDVHWERKGDASGECKRGLAPRYFWGDMGGIRRGKNREDEVVMAAVARTACGDVRSMKQDSPVSEQEQVRREALESRRRARDAIGCRGRDGNPLDAPRGEQRSG